MVGTPRPSALSYLGIALEQQFCQTSVTLNQTPASLAVISTAGYPATGTIPVSASVGAPWVTATYTGVNPTNFTGVTVATGSVAMVASVSVVGQEGFNRQPTAYIPIKVFTPSPQQQFKPDEGMRGSMGKVYNKIATIRYADYDVAGEVFADTFGWWLAGVGGDVVTTGSTAPYSHAIALRNNLNGEPTPLTLNDFYAAGNRQYPGARVSDLMVKFSADGLLDYTAKLISWVGAPATTPTSTFTAVTPLPAWLCTASVGGALSVRAQSGEVNFKRDNSKPIHTLQNSQDPFSDWVGPLQVTGKLLFVMSDDTELNYYLSTGLQALDLSFQTGVGAALQQVKLHFSQVQFDMGKPVRGKSYVEIDTGFEAVLNTTDAGASGGFSPFKATLQNAVTPQTYSGA